MNLTAQPHLHAVVDGNSSSLVDAVDQSRPRWRRTPPQRPPCSPKRAPGDDAAQPARRRLPPRPQRRRPHRRRPVRANIGIDIRQQGRQLVVDFINTNVPRNLVRRLDVGDFGTPVRFVDTFEQGGNARMVIEPRGLWEYSAYQTDTQFIVEVKPVQEDPNRLVQSSAPRLRGREALAQLPERRSARGAAGDRRLHRPQHHHQRHRAAATSRCA